MQIKLVVVVVVTDSKLDVYFYWSSVIHLTLIAWERYVAVQKRIEYKSIVTKSRLNKFTIIAWVSATFMVQFQMTYY